MQRLAVMVAVLALGCVSAFAQFRDYKKGEFYVGYSHNQVDTGVSPNDDFSDLVDRREGFNGFEVAGVYNFGRYVGLKGSISGTYNSKSYAFTVPTTPPATGQVAFDTNNSLYNFLGGVQFKDNASEARVKPFAHILAGAGHGRVNVKNLFCDTDVDCSGFSGTVSETGFAGAFGGGIDVKLSDRVDLRLFQIDYNPIRFDNATTHNFRFGIGFVFK